MRRTKLAQKRHGQELPVALAKVRFESLDKWADSRPSPTEHWREVCRGVVAIGAKIIKDVPRQLKGAMSGGWAGVRWSLDLMRAADRRETTP